MVAFLIVLGIFCFSISLLIDLFGFGDAGIGSAQWIGIEVGVLVFLLQTLFLCSTSL